MSILRDIKISHPIFQAPMAGVTTPQLAAAVSNTGALGALGLGSSSVAKAAELIQETMSETGAPFNVNFFCHSQEIRNTNIEKRWIEYWQPDFEKFAQTPPKELGGLYKSFNDNIEMQEMLLDLRPKVVSFHFGIPSSAYIKKLCSVGVYTMATVTSLLEARLVEKSGIQAVIAQGIEAGGHRGVFQPLHQDQALSTSSLVKELVRYCSLPVVAAGGIMNGKEINLMLDYGAEVAQLGTAFLLCPEALSDGGYRDRLKCAKTGDTFLSKTISGRPARGIMNKMMRDNDTACPTVPTYPYCYSLAKSLHATAIKHDCYDYGAHWAGEGVVNIREMEASRLVDTLVQEMQEE